MSTSFKGDRVIILRDSQVYPYAQGRRGTVESSDQPDDSLTQFSVTVAIDYSIQDLIDAGLRLPRTGAFWPDELRPLGVIERLAELA